MSTKQTLNRSPLVVLLACPELRLLFYLFGVKGKLLTQQVKNYDEKGSALCGP